MRIEILSPRSEMMKLIATPCFTMGHYLIYEAYATFFTDLFSILPTVALPIILLFSQNFKFYFVT